MGLEVTAEGEGARSCTVRSALDPLPLPALAPYKVVGCPIRPDTTRNHLVRYCATRANPLRYKGK